MSPLSLVLKRIRELLENVEGFDLLVSETCITVEGEFISKIFEVQDTEIETLTIDVDASTTYNNSKGKNLLEFIEDEIKNLIREDAEAEDYHDTWYSSFRDYQ